VSNLKLALMEQSRKKADRRLAKIFLFRTSSSRFLPTATGSRFLPQSRKSSLIYWFSLCNLREKTLLKHDRSLGASESQRHQWCPTSRNESKCLNQAVVTGKVRNTMHPSSLCQQVSEVLTTLRSPLPIYRNLTSINQCFQRY